VGNETRGLIWPLALVFLLTLCGGFVGLFAPWLFGNDKTVALWLLLAALVSGGVLYFPRLWLIVKAPDFATVATNIEGIHAALLGAQGNENKLVAISTAIANLNTSLDTLNARLDAPNGDVRADIQAIRNLLATGGVHTRLAAIAAQLDAGGGVRTDLEGITTQLTTGEVRKLLADANTKLDAIKTKLQA
jgi:hypothetical protein